MKIFQDRGAERSLSRTGADQGKCAGRENAIKAIGGHPNYPSASSAVPLG
jgi:hypothetical protein